VGGIAEIINVPGRVNVDFEDVKTVMGEPGKAMMGTAVATGPDRARIAAEQAVACPLLEGTDLTGAKGLLVLITAASKSLKLSESRTAMTTIKEYASKDAHVIYGTAYDESLGDAIRVTVVATGLSRQMAKRAAPPLQVLRTGTDNHAFAMPSMSPSAMGVGTSSAAMAGNSAATAASVPTVGTATLDGMGSASPRVWGTNRTHAAARVDALSSGGMDDYDIPAFLRKQAD
jgi:cell division protein FtsZ